MSKFERMLRELDDTDRWKIYATFLRPRPCWICKTSNDPLDMCSVDHNRVNPHRSTMPHNFGMLWRDDTSPGWDDVVNAYEENR